MPSEKTDGIHFTKMQLSVLLLGWTVIFAGITAVALRSLFAGTRATKNTPMVVRGGAMTAFAEKSTSGQTRTYQPTTNPPGYCLDFDDIGGSSKFYVQLDDGSGENVKNPWANPKKVIIRAHGYATNPPAKTSRIMSLEFDLQQVSCDPSVGGKSVHVSNVITYQIGGAITTTQGVYEPRLPRPRGNHTDNLRFRDPCPDCDKDMDADMRERMVSVDVDGDMTKCADGDCTVTIGLQPPPCWTSALGLRLRKWFSEY